MELAKEEHRQYQNWADTKTTKKSASVSKEKQVRNRFVSEPDPAEENAESFQAVQEQDKQKLAERLAKLKDRKLKLDN
jgi:replication initiation and membrane attachment protein